MKNRVVISDKNKGCFDDLYKASSNLFSVRINEIKVKEFLLIAVYSIQYHARENISRMRGEGSRISRLI